METQYSNILDEHPILTGITPGIPKTPIADCSGMEEALNYIMYGLGFGGTSVDQMIKDLDTALETVDFDDEEADVPTSFEETLRPGMLWNKEGITAVRDIFRRLYGK